MEIKARFPEKQIYALFPRIPTQAMIKGFYYANNVEVTSEGVEEFTIFIHSDFFEIEYPVKVVWNGEIVWNNIVNADPDYMLKNYIENRDRKMLYVNELHFIRKPGVDVIQGIPHKSGEIN
jgi:hypothetical protein